MQLTHTHHHEINTESIEELTRRLEELKNQRKLVSNYNIKEISRQTFKEEFNVVATTHRRKYKRALEKARYFAFIDSVFEVVLTKLLSAEEVNKIIDKFKLCVETGAFNPLVSLYSSYKDNLEMRNLIKFCSALYRWKYFKLNRRETDSTEVMYFQCQSSLKSELKYASACASCGKLAFDAAILFKQLGFIDDI